MSKPAALVTGATGLLGRQVKLAFERADWPVTGTGFSRGGNGIVKCDLTDESDVKRVLDEVKPGVVVHCAANRFPDSVEKDPEAARRLNVDSTASLATECANRGIVLIYISTDYVFPGREGEAPYAADAVPEPTNLYGQLKLDGEWEVLRAFKSAAEEGKSGKGVVLRVPVLYGHVENKNNGESAVNTLVDAIYKAQKEPVKMDHWAKRFPTNTEDVARVLVSISEIYTGLSPSKLPRGHSLPEVLQFSSEDCYTKYEICKLLAEEILALSLEKMEPDTKGNEGNIGTLRPYDCHLSTQELKDLGVDVNTQDFLGWWRRELHAFRH